MSNESSLLLKIRRFEFPLQWSYIFAGFVLGFIAGMIVAETAAPNDRDECISDSLEEMQNEIAVRQLVGICTRRFPSR